MILVHHEKWGLEKFRQGQRIFGSIEELQQAFPWPQYGLVEKPLSGKALELYMTEQALMKNPAASMVRPAL